MGMLYKRNTTWWIKYYLNGRPVRESAGTEKETEPKRFLKLREGRVASGTPILPRADRIRYDEIADDLPSACRSPRTAQGACSTDTTSSAPAIWRRRDASSSTRRAR